MGIYIHLQVLPHRIRSTEWLEAYDESLRLLQSHPSGLMAMTRQAVGDLERLVYTRQLEAHLDDPERRHWGVVGDMTSKRTAESFVVYRDPGHYRIGEKHRDDIDEILAAVHEELRTDRESESRRSCYVFGEKTQGEPYHVPVLAAGLLFESRFAGAALVFGDFDRAEGEQAAAWAGTVAGARDPAAGAARAAGHVRSTRAPLRPDRSAERRGCAVPPTSPGGSR